MDKENGDRNKSKPGDANPLLDPLNVFAGMYRLLLLFLWGDLWAFSVAPRLSAGFWIEYKYNIKANNVLRFTSYKKSREEKW